MRKVNENKRGIYIYIYRKKEDREIKKMKEKDLMRETERDKKEKY